VDPPLPPLPNVQILSRPQPGNGQNYFDVLHRVAGREGWGRPLDMGKGSYGKHAHREIFSLEMMGTPVDVDRQLLLFDSWLEQRSLQELVKRHREAQTLSSILSEPPRLPVGTSAYYSIGQRDGGALGAGARVRQAFCGSYFYTAWNTIACGARGSGTCGDGGDSKQPGFYCTPNVGLAYDYAVPHQLFGNGVFFKIVYDLEIDDTKMMRRGEVHRGKYNHEFCVDASGVQLKGFWLVVDCCARRGDHRLFDWLPELEAIPHKVLLAWSKRRLPIETTAPPVIADEVGRGLRVQACDWGLR